MLKIGFGKRIKPRSFDFIPRFYNPAKEELDSRIKKYEVNSNTEEHIENVKNRIRTNLQLKYHGDPGLRRTMESRSNLRLVLIILVLGMASYLLLSSNKIIVLLEALSK